MRRSPAPLVPSRRVVRELIDGRADTYRDDFGDATKWREYVAKVQAAADVFAEKL